MTENEIATEARKLSFAESLVYLGGLGAFAVAPIKTGARK
jgi:hypothetical protein